MNALERTPVPSRSRPDQARRLCDHLPKLAPPIFATVAEERRHRKERLAGGFRIFAASGFSEGVAGHITARDPEFTDTFWVNPFGMTSAAYRASRPHPRRRRRARWSRATGR